MASSIYSPAGAIECGSQECGITTQIRLSAGISTKASILANKFPVRQLCLGGLLRFRNKPSIATPSSCCRASFRKKMNWLPYKCWSCRFWLNACVGAFVIARVTLAQTDDGALLFTGREIPVSISAQEIRAQPLLQIVQTELYSSESSEPGTVRRSSDHIDGHNQPNLAFSRKTSRKHYTFNPGRSYWDAASAPGGKCGSHWC